MAEMIAIQKDRDEILIPLVKRTRPLDMKTIARYADFFVIKGDTTTLKMGMSTFLT